jgi:hypothetical protein
VFILVNSNIIFSSKTNCAVPKVVSLGRGSGLKGKFYTRVGIRFSSEVKREKVRKRSLVRSPARAKKFNLDKLRNNKSLNSDSSGLYYTTFLRSLFNLKVYGFEVSL